MTQDTIYNDVTGTDPGSGAAGRDAAQEARRNLQRLWLAGVGAMALACDAAGDQFERFVRRGEQVRDDLQDRTEELRREGAGRSNRMRGSFQRTMDVFLDGLHVPNKTDVDTINIKLNLLTRKIDDLQMQNMGANPAAAPPGPASAAATPPETTEPGEIVPPS